MTEFSPNNEFPKWHRTLFVWAAVMVYVLVLSGGIVCITDSSHGCPDWPTCHERWFPPNQVNSIVEYSHRLLTPLTLPFLIAAAVVARRRYRSEPLDIRSDDRGDRLPGGCGLLRRSGHPHGSVSRLGCGRSRHRPDGARPDGRGRLRDIGPVPITHRSVTPVGDDWNRPTRVDDDRNGVRGPGQRRSGLETRRSDALSELARGCRIGQTGRPLRVVVSASVRRWCACERFDRGSRRAGLANPTAPPSPGTGHRHGRNPSGDRDHRRRPHADPRQRRPHAGAVHGRGGSAVGGSGCGGDALRPGYFRRGLTRSAACDECRESVDDSSAGESWQFPSRNVVRGADLDPAPFAPSYRCLVVASSGQSKMRRRAL